MSENATPEPEPLSEEQRERLLLLADMTAVLEPTAEETAEVFGTRQETVEWLDANVPSEVADWARSVFDRAQAERPVSGEETTG